MRFLVINLLTLRGVVITRRPVSEPLLSPPPSLSRRPQDLSETEASFGPVLLALTFPDTVDDLQHLTAFKAYYSD